MLMFSSRLMPPINTRCKLGEFAPRANQTPIKYNATSAQRLMKARILLKADVSDAGDGWSDSRIIEALETNALMVYRVRKTW